MIVGNCTAGDNPARLIALASGLSVTAMATTVGGVSTGVLAGYEDRPFGDAIALRLLAVPRIGRQMLRRIDRLTAPRMERMIFADRTLVELAKRHPTNKVEMRRVPGIGPAKIEKYGDAFLEALRGEGSA